MTTDDHGRTSDARVLVEAEGQRLFGLAYRMLGSVTDAEDAVQEAFMRWSAVGAPGAIETPAAWLTTTLTRVCIDRLRSAQRRRETYVGTWLPEPIATDTDPSDAAAAADSLTFAFLVVLESLTPLERAAFLLHDVFGHDFVSVAAALDRSPAAVRQLASRARAHVAAGQRRARASRAEARQVTEAFLSACAGEDLEELLGLLAPDVTFLSDGGGLATAVPAPVEGAQRVAMMLLGFWRVGQRRGLGIEVVEANTEPAVLVRDGSRVESLLVIEVADGRVSAIRGVRNPEKLRTWAADGERDAHGA